MLEIADILQQAGSAFVARRPRPLSRQQQRCLRDLTRCRTAELGGHLRQCDHCPELRFTYHSCRNRHCPKCQGGATEQWLEAWRQRWLDVPAFLLTFTLPAGLRALAYAHPAQVYDALMRSAAGVVMHLARDERFLGGDPGLLGVLHTWTRDLRYHPHAHFLVTGGGLSEDRSAWKMPKHSHFLLPGRVLSELFRRRFERALGPLARHSSVSSRVWRSNWVVHAKEAGGGHEVLAYLARYVHRVALPNSRLEHFDGEHVTFRYRDGKSQKMCRCRLTVDEFLERFLRHVLPRGFVKVRAYGLLASARQADLERARELLEIQRLAEDRRGEEERVDADALLPDPDPACPACGIGRLRVVADLPRVPVLRTSLPRAPPMMVRSASPTAYLSVAD